MKNIIFHFLLLFFAGTLCSQTPLSTDNVGNWKLSPLMTCNATPLSPAAIAALTFPTTPSIVCTQTNAVTGNSKIGLGTSSNCNRPSLENFVFRNNLNFTSQPCLITYNFTADNAFRVYVNGTSSPTNILPGASGVCGGQYSGNDWTTAFTGTLNAADFVNGNNQIYFETTNGTSSGSHPYWLSGSLLAWQFSDLDASIFASFSYDAVNHILNLGVNPTPQTNGALFKVSVEFSNSYPANPIWHPHYETTGSLKHLKLHQSPPVEGIICDADGAAVRIIFEAMAGECKVTRTYLWSCEEHFAGGPIAEHMENSESSTDNHDFTITQEQIMELHQQYNEKMAANRDMEIWVDSVLTTAEVQLKPQVFPNPAKDRIWIKAISDNEDFVPVQIFNQLGEIVFDGKVQNRQGLDVSTFPNGLYFLKTFGPSEQQHNGATSFILQR